MDLTKYEVLKTKVKLTLEVANKYEKEAIEEGVIKAVLIGASINSISQISNRLSDDDIRAIAIAKNKVNSVYIDLRDKLKISEKINKDENHKFH